MLINDVDLVRIEPRLFLDAADNATELLSASDGAVSGTAVSSASSDFEAADIDAGHVILVDGEALEVDERTDPNTLEVSRPRVDDAQAQIAPAAGTSLAISVTTFERLISQEEAWALGAVGIDPAHPTTPLDDSAIVDTSSLEHLVALRAIANAYERAAALAPTDDALAQRAALYRNAANQAAHATLVILDTDGDGTPDATRCIDTVVFRV